MISRIEILEKFKSRCKRLDIDIRKEYDDEDPYLESVIDVSGDYLNYADAVALLNDILVEVLDD